MLPFRFALHSSVAPTMSVWRERARRAESLGYSAIYLTDHFSAQFGPLVAATIAAEATTTLHVGTLVLNNDLRNPVVLAKEIATLGLAAEGRIEFGVGAGFLQSDYDESGTPYDDARVRVARLAESLTIMRRLWSEGETTFEGSHYSVRAARCEPRPASPPRIIVGGGSQGVLTVAAQQADIVGVNTSLASGERGASAESKATSDHYDRCLSWIRAAAGERFPTLELQLAAYVVNVVASHRTAVRTAMMFGYSGETALDIPFILIGSEDELCDRLLERRERWRFSNVVVPEESMEVFAPVVARLSGR